MSLFQLDCDDRLSNLHKHLFTVEHLHQRFVYYQAAFSKLILEISRRRVYTESANAIVQGMMAQLEAMTEGKPPISELYPHAKRVFLQKRDVCGSISTRSTERIFPRISVYALATHLRDGRSCRGTVNHRSCCRILKTR